MAEQNLRFSSSEIVKMKESVSYEIRDEDTKQNLLKLISGMVYIQDIAKDLHKKNEEKFTELQETLSNYEKVIHSEKVKRHSLQDQLKTLQQENVQKSQPHAMPNSLEYSNPPGNQFPVIAPQSSSDIRQYRDSLNRTDNFAEPN